MCDRMEIVLDVHNDDVVDLIVEHLRSYSEQDVTIKVIQIEDCMIEYNE